MNSFVVLAALTTMMPTAYTSPIAGSPAMVAPSPIQQAPAFNPEDAWNKTRNAISSRYYDKDKQKERMNALLDKYATPAKAAKTPEEFRDVVLAMIKDFGDSHFDFMTKEDQGFYMMRNLINPNADPMPNIGVWFKKLNGKFVAQMVLNDFPGAEAGIQKGDVFKSVNGKPFSPVSSMRDFVDKKASFTIVRNGQEMTKEIDVESTRPVDMFLNASRRSIKTIEYNGKKYGYIHMWTLLPRQDHKDVMNSAISRNMNTDGFILDIRDGFGGRPEGFSDLFYLPPVELQWSGGVMNQTQKIGYGKPLMVLINEGSRSAKEVLAQILKTTKRGTLIGKTTAGHVLGTSPMPIDDWAVIEIPMVDLIVDGVRLEGVGATPNIVVDPEIDAQGNDLVIKKALETLAAGK